MFTRQSCLELPIVYTVYVIHPDACYHTKHCIVYTIHPCYQTLSIISSPKKGVKVLFGQTFSLFSTFCPNCGEVVVGHWRGRMQNLWLNNHFWCIENIGHQSGFEQDRTFVESHVSGAPPASALVTPNYRLRTSPITRHWIKYSWNPNLITSQKTLLNLSGASCRDNGLSTRGCFFVPASFVHIPEIELSKENRHLVV